jgi:hypothetical protein
MDRLVDGFSRAAKRNPALRRDVSVDVDNLPALWALIKKNPINAWVGGRGGYFSASEDGFRTAFSVRHEDETVLRAMTEEIVQWRLAEYVSRSAPEYESHVPELDVTP